MEKGLERGQEQFGMNQVSGGWWSGKTGGIIRSTAGNNQTGLLKWSEISG